MGENDYLIYGCSSMQGYRVSMEDRHNTIADVDKYLENNEKLKQQLEKTGTKLSFFGVYDGHSGKNCFYFFSYKEFYC